jgi:hexosaminidase
MYRSVFVSAMLMGLALSAAGATTASGGDAVSLVPLPKALTLKPGVMALSERSRIVAGDKALAPLATILSQELLTVTGLKIGTAEDIVGTGEVLLQLDPVLKDEAYTLEVTDKAVVKGGDYNSVASGTVTLLQALRAEDGTLTIPRMTIDDKPAYPFRAALIDLARKYHSPGGIKQVVELCRLYKIRYLHLHISDDQLFMFPSTAFPQVGKGNREFARFEPASKPRVDPYTLDELKDLERFAQERGVHLVPELDLPGHSGRLVGDARETFGFPGNGSTVNIASPKTLKAVTTLLNEVLDVFQSTPYVHLGADEVGLGGDRKSVV